MRQPIVQTDNNPNNSEITIAGGIADSLGRAHAILCGRGTTALWLALRAIARRDGVGEVIFPDILCQTALEGVLLAGFTPIFAPVTPGRFTLSVEGLRDLITPRTRAVLVAHLFGHMANIDEIRAAAGGIPIVEDAVQGIGGHYSGRSAGALGDLSIISFDDTKMIGGRGGLLLFDNDSFLEDVYASLHFRDTLSVSDLSIAAPILSAGAAEAYIGQLRKSAPTLLRQFNPAIPNVERIERDWQSLKERIDIRNANARFLESRLSSLPLSLPQIRDGDAIWRYTITAPSSAVAGRIARGLQQAGLSGSRLYYPLSRLFGQTAGSGDLAYRLVNLWVDDAISQDVLEQTIKVIYALPWTKLGKEYV